MTHEIDRFGDARVYRVMKLHARLVLAVALTGGVSLPAHADEPAKVVRAPAAPSRDLADLLAKAKAALGAEQQAALATAVADAQQRLLAGERAAIDGKAEPLAVDTVVAAALVDAGLGGKSKLRPVFTALATMQLAFDLHDALRDRIGHRLAVEAVKACKGEVACADAITPTAEMTAAHIAAARKAKDIDAKDRLDQFELQTLKSVISRVKTSDKQQKAVLDFIKG